MKRILIVDDKQQWQELLPTIFEGLYECDVVNGFKDAKLNIESKEYVAICCNLNIPTRSVSRKLLIFLRDYYSEVPVILITGIDIGGGSVDQLTESIVKLTESIENLGKLKEMYPNVKDIIIKGFSDNFVERLITTMDQVIQQTPYNVIKSRMGEDTQQRFVSWLHLSDLHIGHRKGERSWKVLRQALLEDLQEQAKPLDQQAHRCSEVIFQPDFLFITGDIAYKADPKEYDEAKSFLKDVWEIFGIDKTKTFIIPGNHDVLRSSVSDDPVHQAIYDNLKDKGLESSQWVRLLERYWQNDNFRLIMKKKFGNYLKFANECSANPFGDLHFSMPVKIDGYHVNIVGCNSSLMSWKDKEDEERGLLIGITQIDEIKENLKEKADLVIGLVHHPEETLHYHDSAWRQLEKISNILLYGHIHKPRIFLKAEPGYEHIQLQGGAIHQDGTWKSQHYSYGRFNVSTRKCDFFLRMSTIGDSPTFICDNQSYPDTVLNGTLSLKL